MTLSKKIIYEGFMVILATLSIATLWTNLPYTSYIVWITWAIFFADFVYRLYNSQNKFDFLKRNPFLLVAAIPLDAVFQVARFARILHLLRLKTITDFPNEKAHSFRCGMIERSNTGHHIITQFCGASRI